MKKMVLGLCLLVLTPVAFAERQALLIGNKNYRVSPLSNPINDVNGLKNQLVKLGFKKITTRVNLNKEQMRKTIRDFRAQLRRGDMALVYYSGHGAQVGGRNFLLPVNHGIQEEFEIEDRAVPLNSILQSLANAPSSSNIVILDACRDNPFKKGFRSSTRGLARLSRQAQGTLVAFAASTGGVSNDGRGKYGTYTKHLIQHIATPNISLNEMFTRVRKGVSKETGRKQFPIVEDGLLETVYLLRKGDDRKGGSYDLVINKYIGVDQKDSDRKKKQTVAKIGDKVVYRIDYGNSLNSKGTPRGTKIYSDYDESKLLITWKPSTCRDNGSMLICNAKNLNPGSSLHLYYQVKIKSVATSPINGIAEIVPDNDSNRKNNTGTNASCKSSKEKNTNPNDLDTNDCNDTSTAQILISK